MLEEFYNLTFQASSNNHPCIRIAEDKDDGVTQVKNCPPCLKLIVIFQMEHEGAMNYDIQISVPEGNNLLILNLWTVP